MNELYKKLSEESADKKLSEEIIDAYIYKICESKETIGTWQDVADVINKELDFNYTESAYRKKWQYFNKIFNSIKHKMNDNCNNDEIEEKLLEIKKEKIKLRDMTNKYTNIVRESARFELAMEMFIDAVNNIPRPQAPSITLSYNEPMDSKEGLVIFGDAHFGKDIKIYGLKGEVLNEYSPEIFEFRMWKLRDEILEIAKKEKLTKINIFDVGDSIEGMLRISALQSIRYGSMDSAIMYAKFVSTWLASMAEYICIDYSACIGNHSQTRPLGSKNGDFPHENLGKFINEFIKADLKNYSNIVINDIPNSYIIFKSIAGYNIMATHGEEKNEQSAISEYENIYDVKINYLIGGHKHHGHTKEVGFGKDYIGCGSIIGVDDFSISLKRVSNPTAKLLILEENKGKIEYTIQLG